ncbi:MAG: ABC transporter substrate-binding protein [Calditrichaceae bacterium]
MMKRFLVIGFSISLFALIVLRCSGSKETESDKAHYGGNVRIGLLGTINDLFPFNITEYNAKEISQYLLNPGLTGAGSGDEPVPELAAGWQIADDHKTITYMLDHEYTWSNGRKINSNDVVSSFNFIRKYQDQLNAVSNVSLLRDPEIIDSLTVRFSFNRPVADPLQLTRFPVMAGEMLLETKGLIQIINDYFSDFTGCGPFLLKIRNEKEIRLERNPYYFGKKPYLDTLTFLFYSDVDSMISALRKQELDFVYDLPVSSLNDVENLADYKIVASSEKGFTFIGWNLRNPTLQSLQIRKALTAALDRATLVDGILSGFAEVEDSPAYPEFWAYFSKTAGKYDPMYAKQLLSAQGWDTRNDEGLLVKDGKFLTLNLLTNIESNIRKELATNIKAYYRTIGIDINLEILPWNKFIERLNKGLFDAVIISWVENETFDPSDLFHSASIKNGNNFMGYRNPEVDALIEQGLTNLDKEIRKKSWIEFQRTIVDELPVTVLFNKKIINIVSNNLQNIRINGRSYLSNADSWWLSKPVIVKQQ